MVFKRQVEGEITKAEDCKVAVYSCPLDIMQTETKVTTWVLKFCFIRPLLADILLGRSDNNFIFINVDSNKYMVITKDQKMCDENGGPLYL